MIALLENGKVDRTLTQSLDLGGFNWTLPVLLLAGKAGELFEILQVVLQRRFRQGGSYLKALTRHPSRREIVLRSAFGGKYIKQFKRDLTPAGHLIWKTRCTSILLP